jgi:phage baseplate assembly protein W
MAYVLGSRLITDTEDFKNVALGLSLPIKKGESGYFESNYVSSDQIKTNISNLLRTKRGERIMYPTFGTGLHELLFNPATPNLEDQIVETIENAFATWLPYVNLDSIEVDLSPDAVDNNRVGIKIDYTLGTNIDTNSVFFEIEG